jgi:hypothetical protein
VAFDGDVERISGLRMRHAQETVAALRRLSGERSAANIAALHELHARHLRELGDQDGAARAERRALRVRQLPRPLRLPDPPTDATA